MSHWLFNRRRSADKLRKPMQGEFFSTDSIDSVADSLVREFVQNSMDAGDDPDEPVHVRFHIGTCEDPDVLASLLDGLWPHLEACDGHFRELRGTPCRFLTAEDFHTTGLRGDPAQMFETAGQANEFFYFFRAEGKTSKRTSSRGSWGIGKYTLPMASMINAFVGLTCRAEESQPGGRGPLVLGQAILDHHELDGQHYLPDGWWCHQEERNDDVLPLPFGMRGTRDGLDAERFARSFDLVRTDEPGLSVVVPYVREELTHSELTASVLKNYGLAIMLDQLTVSVSGDGDSVTLTSDTLREAATCLPSDRRQNVIDEIDLAEWYLREGQHRRVELSGGVDSLKWDTRVSDEEGERIREALDGGARVAVRVPMPVELKSGERDVSWFDVLLEADEDYVGTPHFYREGLRISEVASPKTHGIRAVVLVSDRPLATMLGAAETPAHVDWQARTDRFRGHFKDGRNWLAFVKKSPGELIRRVRSGGSEEDLEVAASFFSTPAQNHRGRGRRRRSGDGAVPPASPPPPPGSRLFRIERSHDGFSITGTEDLRPGDSVLIRVAYDVRKGDPLAKWHSADFLLEERVVELLGVGSERFDSNGLELTVTEPERFRVAASGFDPHRDLVVVAQRTEVDEP